ncbi:Retrovirus-related Pol polyprotein, partial [Mucuna pruriens]
MLFGLCNAPSTFQRCMINIFSNLLEDCMEVFMDDFTIYVESFEACLCIETNLVPNFEKCHFMDISYPVEGLKSTKIKSTLLLLYLTLPLCRRFTHFLDIQAVHQEFQQDHLAFVQAALERCFPRAKEATYLHTDSIGTELGVFVRADV